MFGRGQRDSLDDDEGAELAGAMQVEMAKEVRRIRDEEGIDLELDSRGRAGPSFGAEGKKEMKKVRGNL